MLNISGPSDEETGEISPDAHRPDCAQRTRPCQETEHISQILQEQIQEHWFISMMLSLLVLTFTKGQARRHPYDELGQFQEFPIWSQKD